MPNDYISREAAKAACGCENAVKYGNETPGQRSKSYSTLMLYEVADAIDDVPAADVAPVVHAKIVTAGEGPTHWAACSACGGAVDPFDRYCRHCPAKFDENPDGGEPHAY
jgi:hypothetical protein